MKRLTSSISVALALVVGAGFGAWFAGAPQPDAAPASSLAEDAHTGHEHGPDKAADASTWTCSMHPQIRLQEAGICPICNMDLIPTSGGVGGQVELSEAARALARIQTTKVAQRSVHVNLRLVGKVAYDETRVARITAWFGGRIERMFVDFTGTFVKKGDHLFSLYSPELFVAQQELIQAERDRGRLAGSPEMVRAAAKATSRAAREKLRLWGLQDWQIRNMIRRGRPVEQVTVFAPLGGIVTHKAGLEGSWVKTGTPIYTIADLSQVWVELDAYESDIRWLRYGQRVRFEVDAFRGREFSGTIAFVSPAMDPKSRTVRVRVNVPNGDLRLKPGMFVRATVSVPVAGSRSGGMADMAGKHICPMHPEVVADKPARCTVCGMKLVPAEKHWLVGPALSVKPSADPLVIPHTAPLLTGKRSVVFVEKEGAETPTYLVREIRLGPRAGDWYVVSDGLMAGERVVSHGAFRLDSAMQIGGQDSVMSHGDGADGQQADDETLGQLKQLDKALHEDDLKQARRAVESLAEQVAELQQGRALRASIDWLKSGSDVAAMKAAWPDVVQLAGLLLPATRKLSAPMPPPGEGVQAALRTTVTAAIAVSAGLAADDATKAKTEAAALVAGLKRLNAAGRAFDPRGFEGAKRLVKGADIDLMRAAFEPVNLALLPLVTLHGDLLEQKVELVFCPMAMDNKGAAWLQAPGEVANPYFGESMLRCGAKEGELGGVATDAHAGHGHGGGTP